jgi:hypothetical protein
MLYLHRGEKKTGIFSTCLETFYNDNRLNYEKNIIRPRGVINNIFAFLPIFGENMAFYLKTNFMVLFCYLNNPIFSPCFFGEEILKS